MWTWAKSKRRIEQWIDRFNLRGCDQPMLSASNLHYEIGERTRGIDVGGIGAMHALVRRLGLIDTINERLPLLKIHLPYHESDHVLTIAYNALSGGTCLQDLELRRQDEAFLNALGARRIPDPTTAGDFFRRCDAAAIPLLFGIFDVARVKVLAQQPAASF